MKNLLPEVQAFVEGLELSKIPSQRQELLKKLRIYIQHKLQGGKAVNLNFICTHNSRRSQLCQVWAETAAFYFGIAPVRTCSGGTEVTAFHPNAVRALRDVGFHITKGDQKENPGYWIRFTEASTPLSYYSKLYDDPLNSSASFAAIMTCSDAEGNCPFIPMAEARFLIKYEDPKKSDGTSKEEEVYAERNRQIATEMFYVFSKIK